ncbi:MAG: bifunctional folylpolyglutamate synthase/dihydrofolate synthase [Candidatus Delongbacteria bacterium]|nr:bifunctional folylpolyglutamate synthase/dihydrofolate synthase [Candidatus Delongbacteria bacterium]
MTDTNIQYLFDRGMFGMKMGLENIRKLLEFLNIDHTGIKTIHIAGTNGKGSTANMLSQMLISCGYKTGLFTSPHLQRFNERIRINGVDIPDDELSEYISSFKEGIEKFNCTFFEANTAIALKYFVDHKVDIAVIEAGLGGRLDSTNILNPLISAVTGIDYDHQKHLGSSIIQIAREKAGIIKPGTDIVLNTRKRPVVKYFSSAARKKGSRLIPVKNNTAVFRKGHEGQKVKFFIGQVAVEADFKLNGTYQKDNLRTALTVIKRLSKNIKLDPLKIKEAVENLKIKARMEKISQDPLIILDAAHNSEGLSFLKKVISDHNKGTVHLITGIVKDKDYENSLRMILNFDSEIYFSQASNSRMLDCETVKNSRLVNSVKNINFFKSPSEAFEEAVINYRKGDMILVSGSHFIIGDFLDGLNNKLK